MLVMAGSYAQEKMNLDEKPEMADAMRANGKIYVVVAVVLIVLVGLFLYLINLDKKIRSLESKHDAVTDDTSNRLRQPGIKDIPKNISN
jgi:hypothetical protein